jgi:aldehyde:ferredoxin oxidoreductase
MDTAMGSKNLKAAVFDGSQSMPAAYPKELKQLDIEGYREVLTKPNYAFWKRKAP